MAHPEAQAWWADVQHLRGAADRTDEARRRADQADLAARRAARERGLVEDELAPRRSMPVLEPAPRPSQPHAPAPRRPHGVAIPARRTVEIRGRTVPAPAVPRSTEIARHQRPARRAVERVGPRPDRIALWALLMGVLLIMVAVGTADAAIL